MGYIDQERFDDEHYLGMPAGFSDKIVTRRVSLTKAINGFCDNNLNLIDVGCGNGATLFQLTDQFRHCTGIDIFDTNEKVFEEIKATKGFTNCDFQLLDIETERPESEFDRLICFEVIEHLRSESSIRYLYDLLKPGGKAAITVPNKWWIFETHGAKLPLLPWNRVPFFSWLPSPIHERFANARIYTKRRITKLLRSAGFKILDVKYITAPLDVLKDGWLKDQLVRSIFKGDTTNVPFLSTSIFLSVEKPEE